MAAATELRWLDEICAEVAQGPSEQPIDKWLLDNVSLDTTSRIQGPYDVGNSPQMREPLRSFQSELVRMVTIIGPNQGGRTKAMEGASLWAIVNRPGSMQWNTSKDEAAKDFAEQRWWPAALSCAPVVAKLPTGGTHLSVERHKERIRSVIFSDGMPFSIQGCSPANLEEKSVPRDSRPRNCGSGHGCRSECEATQGRTADRRWLELGQRYALSPVPFGKPTPLPANASDHHRSSRRERPYK